MASSKTFISIDDCCGITQDGLCRECEHRIFVALREAEYVGDDDLVKTIENRIAWSYWNYLSSFLKGLLRDYRIPIAVETAVESSMNQMIVSMRRFDPNRGIRFSTFLFKWMKQALWRAYKKAGKERAKTFFHIEFNEREHSPIQSHHEREHESIDLDSLRPQEQEVIIARYGLDGTRSVTLMELGRRMKVSKQRISQIEHAAIAKLRAVMNSKALLERV